MPISPRQYPTKLPPKEYRVHKIIPNVFIVADFRLFHGSMPVHFVDDHSKSQEINLSDERPKQI